MNNPLIHLLLADSNGYYEFGQHLKECTPHLLKAAQDPLNIALAGAGAAGLLGAAIAAPKVLGKTYGSSHRALFKEPGSIRLGWRKGRFGSLVPVDLALCDRARNSVFVAPTGGAKSSFFEWIYLQDLLSGMTTLVVENMGDFGYKAATHALLRGRPVYLFDPTVKNALKWNPLKGSAEDVAKAAVDAFTSSAANAKDPYFTNVGAELLRHTIIALKAWEKRGRGRTVHMGHVYQFLLSPKVRARVLKLSDTRGADEKRARPKVRAKNLPYASRLYFDEEYLKQTQRQRQEHTQGLRTAIGNLLGTSLVRRALCPESDEQTLSLEEAVNSEGLVFLSIPVDRLGETQARTLSTWMLLSAIRAIRQRGEWGRPVSMFMDEAHSMLGHASSEAAASFATWVVTARHYHTILHLAFQSYSLLPIDLKNVMQNSLRNRFIGGGLAGEDVREAREIMGYSESDVTDERRTYRGLWSLPTRSLGTRRMEQPSLTEEEVRLIRLGYWNARILKNRNDQSPVLLKAGRASAPGAPFAPERITGAAQDDLGRKDFEVDDERELEEAPI